MSHSELQTIIGTAITDASFCRRLLESPAEIADEFSLDAGERAALLTIRADSLVELASQLDTWIQINGHGMPNGVSKDRGGSQKWVLLS